MSRRDDVRQALGHVHRLRQRGATRSAVLGRIGAVSGGLLADDATGIGVSNDFLLIPCALAALAVLITHDAPADGRDLENAWGEVSAALTALEMTIADVTATTNECPKVTAVEKRPPLDECTAHYSLCLLTPLGNRNSGGAHGHSACQDCLLVCQGQGAWPTSASSGRDCRWWNY